VVDEDQAFGRTGWQVDADLARELELRRRHPGIAWPDDPVDRLETHIGQPERECPDRLRPAGDDERIDLEQAGRGEEDRVEVPIRGGWRGDDDLIDAGHPGRDDGHDQARWVGGRAAGHVAANSAERHPAALDRYAGHDLGGAAGGALTPGEAADVRDRALEGGPDLARQAISRYLELTSLEDEPSVWQPATVLDIRPPNAVVRVRAEAVEDGASPLADPVIRDRATAAQQPSLAHGLPVRQPEVQAT